MTVGNGGHVAPGASIESLSMGGLTLNPGSVLDFELGPGGAQDFAEHQRAVDAERRIVAFD